MDIPFIERVKIQAEVLVPLVKLLETELGETRARELARKGLRNWARELGRSIGAAPAGTSVQKIAAALPVFAADGALEVDVLRQDANAFDFNVTSCRYARFYQELGVAKLGFLMVCSVDHEMTEGVGPDVELRRTQTLMQGASHCDFRWRLKG